MKRCYKCKRTLSRESFIRNRSKKDGLATECRECAAEMKRCQYQRNKQKVIDRAAQWKRDNPEKIKVSGKRYRERHIERIKAYREGRKEERARYDKHYYRENREAIRCMGRAYYERNRERIKVATRRWAKNNRDKTRLYAIQYQNKRRAWLNGTESKRVLYERVLERDGYRCHLCGKRVTRKHLSFDHVIPLSKGGANVEMNIAMAHRSCNSQKHNKVLHLF